MLPKQYHAILFIGILVMLLLLGLHLLGIGYSGGQAAAKSAALARNASQTQTSSSTNVNAALSPSQAYRHPIVYDKLTGATNNQINDVLGAGGKASQLNDYPIDHYQQQQQQHLRQQQQPPSNNQFDQLPQDDFFNSIHRQGGPPFPPINHHPTHPMHLPMGPHGMQLPPPMMTTQTPTLQPQLGSPPRQLQLGPPLPPMAPPPPPPAPISQRPAANEATPSGSSAALVADSLPSASSLNNDGSPRQPASVSLNGTSQKLPAHLEQQQQALYQQQQQPTSGYYTPPIFAYNNFDQNRPMVEPQSNLPFGFPQQQQQSPLGVPEPPLSIDEFNARQARLRPQNQQLSEMQQIDRYGKQAPPRNLGPLIEPNQFQTKQQQQPNLLADPQQQLRHKQQMLDRNQLLFGGFAPDPNNQSNYYPDPALGYRPPAQPNPIRPPYAHNMPPQPPSGELVEQFGNNGVAAAQSRIASPVNSNNKLEANQMAKLVATERPLKLAGPQSANLQQQLSQVPVCARQQQQAANETSFNSTLLPMLFCNEDPEYPKNEIMRALESYANERSIEQLLPQPLVQIHLNQKNQENPASVRGQLITLDALQPSIGGSLMKDPSQPSSGAPVLFPSANYETMCRSITYMAQPRRAKNLLGQWKIVVNLPGFKYRGIAISQMLRIEECSKPNSECNGPNLRDPPSAAANRLGSTPAPNGSIPLPRSRCLQQYENQRLVAWSSQQGLHVDIFRVPLACSCHIRR